MRLETFIQKYANTPLNERCLALTSLTSSTLGGITLDQAYFRLKVLEDEIRPLRLEQDEILDEIERLNIFK